MGSQLTVVDETRWAGLEAAGLRRYADIVGLEEGEIVGRGGTTTTRRFQCEVAGAVEDFYLKTYRYDGRRRRHRFRVDKGTVEAANYRTLRDRCGIDVPDVVAHGSRRRGWRLLDAFILTRGVREAEGLDRLFERRWPSPGQAGGDPLRAWLLSETAGMVARMHRDGYYHIDLQWRNIILSGKGTSRLRIYLFDSPRGGLRRWAPYRAHGRLRDLSSLYKEARHRLTRAEQFRWIRRYLGRETLTMEDRALIRTIPRDRASKDSPECP